MRKNKKKQKEQFAEVWASLGNQQIAVAELEAVGLPLRIINLLEDYLGVIWLEDLLKYTPGELRQRVPNLGDKSLKLLVGSIHRLAKVLRNMPDKPRPAEAPPVRMDNTPEGGVAQVI